MRNVALLYFTFFPDLSNCVNQWLLCVKQMKATVRIRCLFPAHSFNPMAFGLEHCVLDFYDQ